MGQSVVAIVVGEGVGEGGGERHEGSGCALRRLVSSRGSATRFRELCRRYCINRAASCRVVPRRAASPGSSTSSPPATIRPRRPRRTSPKWCATSWRQGRRTRHLRPGEPVRVPAAPRGNGRPAVGQGKAFHLDEYVGLPITHGASFRGYLQERLFEGVNEGGQSPRPGGARRYGAPAPGRSTSRASASARAATSRSTTRRASSTKKSSSRSSTSPSVPPAAGGRGLVRLNDEAPAQAATLTMPAIMRAERLRRLPRRAQADVCRGDRGSAHRRLPGVALRTTTSCCGSTRPPPRN